MLLEQEHDTHASARQQRVQVEELAKQIEQLYNATVSDCKLHQEKGQYKEYTMKVTLNEPFSREHTSREWLMRPSLSHTRVFHESSNFWLASLTTENCCDSREPTLSSWHSDACVQCVLNIHCVFSESSNCHGTHDEYCWAETVSSLTSHRVFWTLEHSNSSSICI